MYELVIHTVLGMYDCNTADSDWIAAFIMSIRTTYKQSGGFQLQLEPNKFDTIGSQYSTNNQQKVLIDSK